MLRFLLFGGGGCGSKQQKKMNTHPPLPHLSTAEFDFQQNTPSRPNSGVWAGSALFLFAIWAGSFFLFCCLGGVVIFRCLGGCMFIFCCLGWGRGGGGVRVFFFAVWAAACLFFGCLCAGRVYFYAVWAGSVFFSAVWAGTGVHSLTGLPGTSVRSPTRKKNQTAKQKHGFPCEGLR